MDKIKVAYSWIGPKGPLWNTEIPNILQFAKESEGASTTSHYFWCDDLWVKFFMEHRDKFDLFPANQILDETTFIYPFSLGWRIPFRSYFFKDNGILEFAHTPSYVTHAVRQNNGYFLIDKSDEAWVQDEHLQALHSYFGLGNRIPMHKLIYVTGAMNGPELYDQFCNRHGIGNDPRCRMHVIVYPSAQQIFATHFKIRSDIADQLVPEYDTEKVPEKLFLMWNRRYRPHRLHLALALDKSGLVDRSYLSMGETDPETPSNKFEYNIDVFRFQLFNFESNDIESLKNKLPLVLDGETWINQMCEDFNNAARPWYQNSLVSIVTETNYDLQEVTLTEKSFKPSKEKHPFIIVGVNGALKAIKNMGFKTFSEFWDESYDDIEDPIGRLKKIHEVCEYIGSWDHEKIKDFRRKVKPILDHNYEMLHQNSSNYVIEKIIKIIKGVNS